MQQKWTKESNFRDLLQDKFFLFFSFQNILFVVSCIKSCNKELFIFYFLTTLMLFFSVVFFTKMQHWASADETAKSQAHFDDFSF